MRMILLPVALAAAGLMTAQMPEIGQSMKANQDALRKYSHKRRTEITYKDKSRSRVDEVRYVDGKMETTAIEGAKAGRGDGGGRRRGGRLAQRKIAKKREEMKEDAEKLSALLHQYLPPPQQAMVEKGSVQRMDNFFEFSATGLVRPKDSMRLTWNSPDRRPERMEIRTDLDGNPVSIAVEFARLPDGGPFYATRATLTQPKKHLTIRVENFDFKAETGAQ